MEVLAGGGGVKAASWVTAAKTGCTGMELPVVLWQLGGSQQRTAITYYSAPPPPPTLTVAGVTH